MESRKRYIDLVNIKMGTHSVNKRSYGNTNPLTARHFGMNHFFPQTREDRGWLYHPDDVRTVGLRLTHIPSPWIGDYANLVMCPTAGNTFGAQTGKGYESSFDVNNAIMTPAYIELFLIRYGIRLEFAPTVRGGSMRFTWDDLTSTIVDGGNVRRFVLNYKTQTSAQYLASDSELHIDCENGKISGCTASFRHAAYAHEPSNAKMYFVFEFDSPFDPEKQIRDDGVVNIAFAGSPKSVNARFATSFISVEQAEFNLRSEIGNKTLEELRAEAEAEWESYLSRIEVEADEATERTFYSCLYRAFLFPRVFHEPCEDGVIRHFSPCNGNICEGSMYVDNGFWDTYKTVYPLYSLIASDKYEEMCRGFVNFYKECGWLPRWTSPYAINCMPGTAIDAVFGDAVAKGVVTDRELISEMLEALLTHSEKVSADPTYGRDGLEAFQKLGYVSNEYRESVNKTLDYAYGDFCISKLSDALGQKEISRKLLKNAKKYRNLFDPATGFMRARNRAGEMREDFTEFDWGGDYTEGGPWQNSFAVYHDFLGYAALLGGREKLLEFIQRLFDTPPFFRDKAYNSEIHEMTEMYLENGFGQCALSNQPSFHVPYLFSCMGDRDRTAYWVRRCVRELFRAEPKGFPGDEDNGSMACWYVFSALGFYPVCPGVDEYVLATPSVKKAVLHLDNGSDFTVSAPSNSDSKFYASKIALNNKKMRNVVIKQQEIRQGGVLRFTMSDKPSEQKYSDNQLPFSLSCRKK